MLKTYIDTAKVVNTHGLRGDVKLEPWTDDPELFFDIDTLYLDAEGKKPLTIENVRPQKGLLLVKFQDIDTVEEAEKLRNKVLYIHRDDIPMEEGEYLIQDLLGSQIVDADSGKTYGKLQEITFSGASDIYHIKFADGSIQLLPAIDDTIIETDLEAGIIRIRPLKGLWDETVNGDEEEEE